MVASHCGYGDSIMVHLHIGLGNSIIVDLPSSAGPAPGSTYDKSTIADIPVHDEFWPQRFGIAVLIDHNRLA